MPQMMPLNWLTLLIFFNLIFIMFNNSNYFLFLYKNKKMLNFNNKNLFKWKW